MKDKITKLIRNFVRDYESKEGISDIWREPIVGFASANHPYILSLKEIVLDTHSMPKDVLPDATVVIAFFIPFTKKLANTNRNAGDIASPEWAKAYEDTNSMFTRLNQCIVAELRRLGYDAAVSPESTVFDREKLMSNWSHRHLAWAAGLGTFGINNMLITKVGCCGRYSTVVTNLDIEPDEPLEIEYCLYKKNGTCGACVKRCPSGALTLSGYDRFKCYKVCMKNATLYTEFGNSYSARSNESQKNTGSEVCGKCVTNMPCTFFRTADLN